MTKVYGDGTTTEVQWYHNASGYTGKWSTWYISKMKNGTKVAGGTYWKQDVELANVVMHGVMLTNSGKITAACVALLKGSA